MVFVGLNLRLILGILCFAMASSASADIFQWHDGDGDDSLWLSSSTAEPYSNLSLQVLWWADLQNTNLSFANLSNSNLSFAYLQYSNLEESDLSYTNFTGANLQSANLRNSNMFYANFSDTNLSNIENWDSGFWLAAKYTQNTIFPDGMSPHDFGMIEVPTPGTLGIFAFSIILCNRRR